MSVEADIVTYLDAQTALTAGTDLFEGPMPEKPDICVAVTSYAGESAAQHRVFGPSLTPPQMEISRFQVASRHTSKATAESTAVACFAKLDGFSGTATRTYFYVESTNGEPFFLKQDDGGDGGGPRYTYVCSYRAQKARG